MRKLASSLAPWGGDGGSLCGVGAFNHQFVMRRGRLIVLREDTDSTLERLLIFMSLSRVLFFSLLMDEARQARRLFA
jgi:hypothetical protein